MLISAFEMKSTPLRKSILVLALIIICGCTNTGAPTSSEVKAAFNAKLDAQREAIIANGLESVTSIIIPVIDSVTITECSLVNERSYRCKFKLNFDVEGEILSKELLASFERLSEGGISYDLLL